MSDSLEVLIVDDSQSSRAILGRILSLQGHEVITAESGFEALSKISMHPQIGLVLCDVNMPGMGGIDFLRRMSAVRSLVDLPVFMMTVERQSADLDVMRNLGVTGFFVKPVRPDSLNKALQTALAAHHRAKAG